MIYRMPILPIVVVLALSTPESGQAWGRTGHRVVCEMAFQRLSDEGRALVRGLQRGESHRFRETCLWADKVKGTTRKDTYNYHFVNIPPGVEGLDMERDCPADDCVVWAIEHYRDLLTDSSRSLQERNEALKFLGHFVADVHQPLHAGRPEDRGGNDIEICFFGDCGRPGDPLNLHQVWDSEILRREYRTWQELAGELARSITAAKAESWRDVDVRSWVAESYRIDEEFVYPRLPAEGIGDEYYREALSIAKERLRQASVRLAYLIDTAARAPGLSGSD